VELSSDNKGVNFKQSLQNYLWDNIPTTVMFNAGGGMKAGFLFELGFNVEFSVAVNLLSGEWATLYSIGPMEYIGTPNGLGGGGYIGGTVVYGVTKMTGLEGKSEYKGITMSLDGAVQGSWAANEGHAVNKDGTDYNDQISTRTIKYREIVAGGGANTIPNGFDIGLVGGKSTKWIDKYYQIPWWPISVR
jgi:hypothetical protein